MMHVLRISRGFWDRKAISMGKGVMLTLSDKESNQCKELWTAHEGFCGHFKAGSLVLMMVHASGIFNLVWWDSFTIW